MLCMNYKNYLFGRLTLFNINPVYVQYQPGLINLASNQDLRSFMIQDSRAICLQNLRIKTMWQGKS